MGTSSHLQGLRWPHGGVHTELTAHTREAPRQKTALTDWAGKVPEAQGHPEKHSTPKDSKTPPPKVCGSAVDTGYTGPGAPVRTTHSATPEQVPERARWSGRALGAGWSLWWHSVADTASCRGMVEALWRHCQHAPGTVCTDRARSSEPQLGCAQGSGQAEPILVLREDSHFG